MDPVAACGLESGPRRPGLYSDETVRDVRADRNFTMSTELSE